MYSNEIWHDPRYYGFHRVCSVQTVQLFCDKISTISKRTGTSFHLSLVNLDYHQVHPKRFLTLWYVWRKPCTYLALTLTPSLNRPKQDSIWVTSPRSFIGFVQNDFQANVTLGVNHAPILRQVWHSPNWPKWTSTWASSPWSTFGCVQNDFWPYSMFDGNRAPILHRR
jgi:hypothetical protein